MSNDIYECRECGKEIARNARTCPHCGHRSTSLLTIILAAAIGLIGIVAIVGSNVPKASESAKTPQQVEDGRYETAIAACEMWAGKNAPGITHTDMAGFPEDVTGTFRLDRRKKDAGDIYRVGFRYRSSGAGFLMRAECAVLDDGQHLEVLEAKARPGS